MTKTQKVPISRIKLNKENPRYIKDHKFEKLKQSLKDFPEMLELRPIVVDSDLMILGGNMRYQAAKDIGMSEVFITVADGLTDEQKKEFIIKDNASFGDWDWDLLANNWSDVELGDWGVDVWQPEEEVDYSILDDAEDIDDELELMSQGVKKAIQIEFNSEHYEEAYELVKFWREQGAYIGGMIMEYLKAEKDKI